MRGNGSLTSLRSSFRYVPLLGTDDSADKLLVSRGGSLTGLCTPVPANPDPLGVSKPPGHYVHGPLSAVHQSRSTWIGQEQTNCLRHSSAQVIRELESGQSKSGLSGGPSDTQDQPQKHLRQATARTGLERFASGPVLTRTAIDAWPTLRHVESQMSSPDHSSSN